MNLFRAYYDFLVYLRTHKDRSPRTLEQYSFHIWRFMKFLAPHSQLFGEYSSKSFLSTSEFGAADIRAGVTAAIDLLDETIENVTLSDINLWRAHLIDNGVGLKTMNAHMITLRSWFKFLKKEGILSIDPTGIDLMRVKESEVVFLTTEEIKLLFSSIETSTIQGKRDFAIIWCIYASGLRVSELTALNRIDISPGDAQQEISIRGKGGKIRTVYLTDEAKKVIRLYLDARDDHFSPLFVRHNFKIEDIQSIHLSDESVRLSRFFITTLIKNHALRSGITKDISAHTLRHSFATTLLGNGADIRIIQELLGHASITTTQIYTHVTNNSLKEAHLKFHHN